MAVLFSATSQLWSAPNWKTVDATSYLRSEAGSTATTTSYVASTTFTPGAITVEGILLRILGTVNVPTGTFSVELYNSTGAASISTVTCNVSDIKNNYTGFGGGWVYFKFGSPVTLLASTNYQVRIKSSVNGAVSVYRNATAGNWSRGLVTSTTAAISTNDDAIICGNLTAPATYTINTITYDYTGANTYNSIEVGGYGKLIGENSPSKNYLLTINSGGVMSVSHNGVMEFSTSLSRLPSSSTFIITLTCATAGATFLDIRNYATFSAYGANIIRKTTLNANATISATSLTTTDITGWKNGDNIGIAGTGGITQQQQRTLNADASGNTLSISAGLIYAVEGTSPVQADIINLTSNFRIKGSLDTLATYVNVHPYAIVNVDNIEFKYVGANTNTLPSFYIQTNSGIGQPQWVGNCNITKCSFWLMAAASVVIYTTGYSVGTNVDECVFYAGNSNTIFVQNSNMAFSGLHPPTNTTIQNSVFIGGQYGWSGYASRFLILTNNVHANSTIALRPVAYLGDGLQTISDCKIYRNTYGHYGASALSGQSLSEYKIVRCTFFRNTYGWRGAVTANQEQTIEDSTFFGNTGANLYLYQVNGLKVINTSFQGGSGVISPYGVYCNNADYTYKVGVVFERCSFGTITQHSSADIVYDNHATDYVFNNCTFGSVNMITGNIGGTPASLVNPSRVAFQRMNGVAGSNRVYKQYGYIINDTTIYDTPPSSQRLVPSQNIINNNYGKLISTVFQIAVANGSTAKISVKVRCSVLADGTDYNGNRPRLILKSNPSAGSTYNSDIICATATLEANGTWETLSYTLPTAVTDNVGMEFYIDCDGTTGWINIDTVAVS